MTKSITKALIFTTLNTSQLKRIDECENISSANPLYLHINHASGYVEDKNETKYLIFDFVDENEEVLMFNADVWHGIKNKIKAINGGKENDYEKDYMKIKFNSDDDLPLNTSLKFPAMTIIIRSVFKEDGKPYPQLFFIWHFTWFIKILFIIIKINISEGIDSNKKSFSSECKLNIGTLKDGGFKFEGHVCNGWHDVLTVENIVRKYSNIKCKRSYF